MAWHEEDPKDRVWDLKERRSEIERYLDQGEYELYKLRWAEDKCIRCLIDERTEDNEEAFQLWKRIRAAMEELEWKELPEELKEINRLTQYDLIQPRTKHSK